MITGEIPRDTSRQLDETLALLNREHLQAGVAQDLMPSKLDAIERRLERLEGDRQR